MKTIKKITLFMIMLHSLVIFASSQEFIEAVKCGDFNLVQTLIKNDADLVNFEDETIRTPLHWASRGVYPEIMQLLIQNGADVNAVDINKITPLISVAWRGHLGATNLLLENGADVNVESNEFNRPALYYAIAQGYKDVTELLLKNGAYVNIDVGFGRTPLFYAVDKGQTEIAELLISYGADISFSMNDGLNLLHMAVIANDLDMVKMLVNKGCDQNAKQRFSLTPLHFAAVYGLLDITKFLIESGSEVSIETIDGGTPYNFAIASNNNDIAELLINKNAVKNQWDFPEINTKFLGITEPDTILSVFRPEVVLNVYIPHGGITFSPEENEIFWTRNSSTGSKIWQMKKDENGWTPPKIFTSSDKYSEEDPYFTHDGQKLFFTSNRPDIADPSLEKHDIWFIEREENSWSDPKATGIQSFFENAEVSGASVSANGNIYFSMIKNENGNTIADIYRTRMVDGFFSEPEKLGHKINTQSYEVKPYIAPDESYLIFTSHRPEGGNLICFRNENDEWSEAHNLNTILPDQVISCQGIYADGKYVFFNGVKDNVFDLYWIDANFIEKLNP